MDRMREMQLRAQHTSLKNRRAAAHRALALWWAETRGRALAHREQELRQRQPLHVCARVAGHKRCHGARRALWALRALVIAAKDAQWQEQVHVVRHFTASVSTV
jgi:hypothetical protein